MDLLYTVNRKVAPKPFLNQERYVIFFLQLNNFIVYKYSF